MLAKVVAERGAPGGEAKGFGSYGFPLSCRSDKEH